MPTRETGFAICLRNDGAEDLDVRKVYRVLPDKAAAAEGYLRVIDESREDYLYPAEYFVFVDLPEKAKRALGATQRRARRKPGSSNIALQRSAARVARLGR
jgi:hypothetical protein